MQKSDVLRSFNKIVDETTQSMARGLDGFWDKYDKCAGSFKP